MIQTLPSNPAAPSPELWCRGCGRPSGQREFESGFCNSCGRDPRTGGTPKVFLPQEAQKRRWTGSPQVLGALQMAAGVAGIPTAWIFAGLVVGDSGWGAVASGAISIAFGWLALKGGIRMAAGRRV